MTFPTEYMPIAFSFGFFLIVLLCIIGVLSYVRYNTKKQAFIQKIRKDDKNLAQIEAGECFGEMALIGGQTRAANVIADMDCVLMKISANIFYQSPQ